MLKILLHIFVTKIAVGICAAAPDRVPAKVSSRPNYKRLILTGLNRFALLVPTDFAIAFCTLLSRVLHIDKYRCGSEVNPVLDRPVAADDDDYCKQSR